MADFEIIAEGVLTGTSNTIDFTSIPSTYSHLELLVSARSNKAGATTDGGEMLVNGDTGSNYGFCGGYAINSGYSYIGPLDPGTRNQIDNALRIVNAGMPTGVFSVTRMMIPNYTNTSVQTKGILGTSTTATTTTATWWTQFGLGSWVSTAAITQLTIYSESVSYPFVAGSSYWLGGWA